MQLSQEAFVSGPTEPPLWSKTFGRFVDEQAATYSTKTATVFPWQDISLTYEQLAERSQHLANAMLRMGFRQGDCVGIMAGNSCQHVEVFLGGARIGCPIASLHSTYTPEELKEASLQTSCKLVFIASHLGNRNLSTHIHMMHKWMSSGALPNLQGVVRIGQTDHKEYNVGLHTYEDLLLGHKTGTMDPDADETSILLQAEKVVKPDDVVNFEFTSGTTGEPKAAALTSINLLGNGRLVGDRMQLTPDDIVCSPLPLFHGFGIIVALLASLSHGSSVVFPSDRCDPHATLEVIQDYTPTTLLGVPTMFLAEIEAMRAEELNTSLRKAVVGGSPVSSALVKNLRTRMKIREIFVAYGMTETGLTFMGNLDDQEDELSGLVGHVMPHICAKVLDNNGRTVRPGQKGELCTSGYSLQEGYYNNETKTSEVMTRDNKGRLWMHTGDEAIIYENGYCRVIGRIKDIIIRGGENISPLEIEERLVSHPSICEASVLGLPDPRYGELVACFLKSATGAKLSTEEVQLWARKTLAWHKAPVHVFWIGEPGVGDDFPRTGSGKYQKGIMQKTGRWLIAAGTDWIV